MSYKCPLCSKPLARILYENTPVHRCGICSGHLLPRWKLDGIQRNPATAPDQLKTEAKSEFHGNTEGRVKCPVCFFLMFKEKLAIPGLEMELDICERCDLIWMDGGELALLQLLYEASEGCLDTRERMRRAQEMLRSPERMARLQKAINNAEGLPSFSSEVLEELLDTLIMLILRQGRPSLSD